MITKLFLQICLQLHRTRHRAALVANTDITTAPRTVWNKNSKWINWSGKNLLNNQIQPCLSYLNVTESIFCSQKKIIISNLVTILSVYCFSDSVNTIQVWISYANLWYPNFGNNRDSYPSLCADVLLSLICLYCSRTKLVK